MYNILCLVLNRIPLEIRTPVCDFLNVHIYLKPDVLMWHRTEISSYKFGKGNEFYANLWLLAGNQEYPVI